MREDNVTAILFGLFEGVDRNQIMAKEEREKGNIPGAKYHEGIAFGYEVAIKAIERYRERKGEGGE